MNTEKVLTAEQLARRADLPVPVAVILARLDPLALGAALAFVAGLGVFLATIILLIRGGDLVGPTLSLLGQYFIGYSVTWAGAILGFFYAAILGFITGFAFALFRNLLVYLYVRAVRNRKRRESLDDLL